MADTDDRIETLEGCVRDLGNAVTTLAWWLHQAQTGFGLQDARSFEVLARATAAEARLSEYEQAAESALECCARSGACGAILRAALSGSAGSGP